MRTPDLATAPASDLRRPDRLHVLVCDQARAWVAELPLDGRIAIGRAEGSDIVLDDKAVSREHVAIATARGVATLHDLGSQNGSLVNGQRVTGPAVLASGDVIVVGGASMVFHSTVRRAGARGAEPDLLRREIGREIERTEVTRRGFAVIAVRAADPSEARALVEPELRDFDLIAAVDDGVMIVCPELDAEAIAAVVDRFAARLGVIGATVGYAAHPRDGTDASGLVEQARTAASEARPGAAAGSAPRRWRAGSHEIVVADQAMVQLYRVIERLAASDVPVLVRGDTGVGKELVATALHAWSRRATQPLVAVNCAALPDALIEAELFGHEKGAFTGAHLARPGLLEAASGGTVFLDEVGDLAPGGQAKLLRAIETRRITRLGSVTEIGVDFRIVAATHRDLRAEVAAGRFRDDLYYRLHGGAVEIPPLRDRPRELALLTDVFVAEACAALGRSPMAVSDGALLELAGHTWPGNVRELRLVMTYLAAAHPERVLTAEHVRARLSPPSTPRAPDRGSDRPPGPLRDEIEALERRRIVEALATSDGHQGKAAEALGMPLRTFVARLKRYGVRRSG